MTQSRDLTPAVHAQPPIENLPKRQRRGQPLTSGELAAPAAAVAIQAAAIPPTPRKRPAAPGRSKAGVGQAAALPSGASDTRRTDAAPEQPSVSPQAGAPATSEGLPAIQDVALGILSILAEQGQRAGTFALLAGRTTVVRWLSLVRMVSPQVATDRADARINALAERGRHVRRENGEALTSAITAAIMSTAVERATDDVLTVLMPAMFQAMHEKETQAAFDDLMAGLLVRQLPAAMEKVLPTLLMRTATRPTQLVPFLGGVLPR